MVEPLQQPERRHPLRRTRQPSLPPMGRSRAGMLLTRAATEGRFALQRCGECGAFCYPAHDVCPGCLSTDLKLTDAPNGGILVSKTVVRVPADVYFRERAPWRIGMVKLDCGPTVIAHLHADCREAEPVRLSLQLDKAGQAAAFARPAGDTANAADDRQWREMTSPPKFRRVLVTNGRSAVGQATAAALVAAGAKVHVGIAEPWKPFEAGKALEGCTVVPLDVTDERSVRDLAADIGGKVDILINTGEHTRPGGLIGRQGTATIMDEISQTYLGFVHLAQAFGPAMRARGADGVDSAAAWVNVFSVYALANWAAFGTTSAAEAACVSLSHCLRAELRAGGVRVVNLFTGPLDTEWFQTVPPPKVAPKAVAKAIVSALESGVEEVFVGDVAEDVRQRLEANPKALERDLGA